MIKRLVFFFVIFLSQIIVANKLKSQSVNYWSVNLNSEATLLGGAVVGGGSGVTSIFYNPAGISEIKQSKVSLNTSMMSLSSKFYKNAFGDNLNTSQISFEVEPRFVSYVFRSKKLIELSWQIAMFNRESRNDYIYEYYSTSAEILGLPKENKYVGIYDFWETYNDYWAGIGTSYEFNEHWKIGISGFFSIKDLNSVKEVSTTVGPDFFYSLNPEDQYNAGWHSYNWVSFFDVRINTKIGVRYVINNELSIGMTISFPSFKLFGYANTQRVLSQANILDNEGNDVPDYIYEQVTNHVKSQFKDPFSVSFGVRRQPKESKNIYSLTVEYFAKINPYKAIDASKKYSISDDVITGTEFSDYYVGNKVIINFALGYKREVKDNLELLFGFKSDFYSFFIPQLFKTEHKNSNIFTGVGADLFHFTGGANFIFKKRFKLNMGGSVSYGRSNKNIQFINFSNPLWYDYDTKLALQGVREEKMTFQQINLGLFLGFSLEF
jgi:long-subunit fatty acid transport protein